MMGEYEDEERNSLWFYSEFQPYIHTRILLSMKSRLVSTENARMNVNATCSLVVYKSVHDPGYKHVLVEEMYRLSSGNSTDRALAMALAEMLALARTVDPDTILRIPSEYEDGIIADQICSTGILTKPLLTFLYGGASNKSAVPRFSAQAPSSESEKMKALDQGDQKHAQGAPSINPSIFQKLAGVFGLGNFWSAGGTKLENKNVSTDIESQILSNVQYIQSVEAMGAMLSVEANLALAAVGGAAIAGLLASGAKDSPSVHLFSAAAAVGFNCSLLAAFTCKNPRVSGFLSKIGAIGTASAVMVALGNTVDTAMFGNVNVNALVIALICFIDVVVIFR